MIDLLYSPLFGVLFTFLLYIIGSYLAPKINLVFLNRYILAVIIGAIIMSTFKIPYEAYDAGAGVILFFLSPIIVLLAVPLYKNFRCILDYKAIFFLGCIFAVIINFIIVYLVLYFYPLETELAVPMFSKSITGGMAKEVNILLGGDPNIAVLMVSFAGLTGGFVGGLIIKLFKIKHTMSKGLGLGAISHVTGTSVAMEIGGEKTSAIASTALTVVGVITVVLLPIVFNWGF